MVTRFFATKNHNKLSLKSENPST